MFQADTPTMPVRRAEQARRLALPLAALTITLALPACQDAAAGDTGPMQAASDPMPPPATPPIAFVPLDLSRHTAGVGGIAARVGRAMARCDRAAAAVHGAPEAAGKAAELCADEAGALDDIKAPERYAVAIDECGNAYGAQVSALRQIAKGKSGGTDAEDMHKQQDFCLTDLAKAKDS